jgi:hypothetical protein
MAAQSASRLGTYNERNSLVLVTPADVGAGNSTRPPNSAAVWGYVSNHHFRPHALECHIKAELIVLRVFLHWGNPGRLTPRTCYRLNLRLSESVIDTVSPSQHSVPASRHRPLSL